ncbi:RES domain-containing protein [Pseudomonas sp. OIL-1]|nr:RES domain-containing protein [Pseudomonas sp. OIL-1]
MEYFRIVKKKWASTAFDGEGARRHGGRWNSKGQRCVYLSSSISLATLEVLVHLQSSDLLAAYVLFSVKIPVEHVRSLAKSDLPSNWQADPAPSETAAIGDGWLVSGDGVALVVPSTVIVQEKNILLNPAHPAFELIVATSTEVNFEFDPRLK